MSASRNGVDAMTGFVGFALNLAVVIQLLQGTSIPDWTLALMLLIGTGNLGLFCWRLWARRHQDAVGNIKHG